MAVEGYVLNDRNNLGRKDYTINKGSFEIAMDSYARRHGEKALEKRLPEYKDFKEMVSDFVVSNVSQYDFEDRLSDRDLKGLSNMCNRNMDLYMEQTNSKRKTYSYLKRDVYDYILSLGLGKDNAGKIIEQIEKDVGFILKKD
jgi:hypothetical protein